MTDINLTDLAVACPDIKGKARFVKSCLSCDHYGGFVQVCDDESRAPEENYHIICNRPTTRRMERIAQ